MLRLWSLHEHLCQCFLWRWVCALRHRESRMVLHTHAVSLRSASAHEFNVEDLLEELPLNVFLRVLGPVTGDDRAVRTTCSLR
jgi:hypothetical protein